jgi:hypothetical protein
VLENTRLSNAGKSHSIFRLCVHLPDSNYVMFHPTENPAKVLERSRSTMLTRFFEMSAEDLQAAQLVYHELPQHYVWQTKTRSWKRRQRCGDKAIGLMVSCSPIDVGRYHLLLLLCYRRGPKSFEDCRTVNDVLYPTFKDAGLTQGYLEDDTEWKSCMREAVTFQMPPQLSHFFNDTGILPAKQCTISVG